MRKLFSILAALLLVIIVGCGKNVDHDDRFTGDIRDAVEESYYKGDGVPFNPSTGTGSNEDKPQAGQLTASEWSDLENYEFYLSLFESSQESETGIFTPYLENGYFDTLNMVKVTVKNELEELISGVSVELQNDNQEVIYKAVTNKNGIAYLFPKTNELDTITTLVVKHNEVVLTEAYQYSKDNNNLVVILDTEDDHHDVIELMFVVDTTGSMGDELLYLQVELEYVISQIKEGNPNTIIKLALLFYRDIGDQYVTRYFDFTTDIEVQKDNLAKQQAQGGGDFEEAVDIALDEAVSKSWSNENTTKLIIHVLDAPPHNRTGEMTRYFNAIMTASSKGIRMIPVASSGINKYTEYLLRNQAMMTGGTYVFLTDHSGIGNRHLEASVGDTSVEYFNQLLVRIINEYHTGVKGEKIPYNQQNQDNQ